MWCAIFLSILKFCYRNRPVKCYVSTQATMETVQLFTIHVWIRLKSDEKSNYSIIVQIYRFLNFKNVRPHNVDILQFFIGDFSCQHTFIECACSEYEWAENTHLIDNRSQSTLSIRHDNAVFMIINKPINWWTYDCSDVQNKTTKWTSFFWKWSIRKYVEIDPFVYR